MTDKNVQTEQTEDKLGYVYAKIGQCILEEKNVEALLKIGEELLGNPIILSNLTTRVYAYSSKESFENINDEILKASTQQGFLPAKYFRKYNYNSFLPEISRLRRAKYFKSDMSQKMNRITVNVFVKEQYFGWLVSPEVNKIFTSDDLGIMDCIAQGVSLLLSNNYYRWNSNVQEIILGELLDNHYDSKELYNARVEGLAWKASPPYRLIGIRQMTTQREELLMAVQNHLSLAAPEIPTIRKDKILFLLNTGEKKVNSDILKPLLMENNLQAAYSALYSDIIDTHIIKNQVIDMFNATNRSENLLYYEEMELSLAANHIKQNLKYTLKSCKKLQAAINYDAEYQTEYTFSIREWLKWRNLAKTAEKLYIHRNTMVYRFEKFQEISGFNLKEGEDIYKLQLAFLLLENAP